MTLKRYTVKQILDNSMNNNVPSPWCYLAADVDAHLKEVEDAHENQLSCMTDTQAYMEDRAHMEQENENLRFELSALKEQHENEDKNEYRPWESEGITELAYWKKRHIEQSREIAIAHDRGWDEAMEAMEQNNKLLDALVLILSHFVGETNRSEGAVEVLERKLAELSALKEQHKR